MNLQEQINRIQSMMGVITEIFDDGEETGLPIYIRRRFDIDELDHPEEEFLNKMGSEGWELVQIHNEPVDKSSLILVKLYFKREIN
jgi:hypothetical protein